MKESPADALKALLLGACVLRPESACRLARIEGSRSYVYEVFVDDDTESRFVAKMSNRAEIRALEAMARDGIVGVARVVVSDLSTDPAMLIMPSYPGEHGQFGSMPSRAIDTLARIHVHFANEGHLGGFDDLSIDELFGWAFGDMSIYEPGLVAKMDSIRDAIDVFRSMIERLPRTLVHWDMHPDNVLASGDDAVIIDWEHASVGPPLIDLTNMIDWGSRGFRTYAERIEYYSGRPFDWVEKRQEFDWCAAMTTIRYMWVPARGGNQSRASEMADAVIRHLDRLC